MNLPIFRRNFSATNLLIFPKYLQGESIVSIPLEEDEVMHIGYILNKDKELSELGEIYVEALKQYQT